MSEAKKEAEGEPMNDPLSNGKPDYVCMICKKPLTLHETLQHKSLTICEGTHPEVFAELRRLGKI